MNETSLRASTPPPHPPKKMMTSSAALCRYVDERRGRDALLQSTQFREQRKCNGCLMEAELARRQLCFRPLCPPPRVVETRPGRRVLTPYGPYKTNFFPLQRRKQRKVGKEEQTGIQTKQLRCPINFRIGRRGTLWKCYVKF